MSLPLLCCALKHDGLAPSECAASKGVDFIVVRYDPRTDTAFTVVEPLFGALMGDEVPTRREMAEAARAARKAVQP